MELLKRKEQDSNITWQDVADFRSEHTGILEHPDTVRKGTKILYEYMKNDWVQDPTTLSHSIIDFGSPSEKAALQKERMKAQTERLETNRWLRELARDEMITQNIVDAIKDIKPLYIPAYTPEPLVKYNDRTWVLCISDPHYGAEFSIKGLYGEVINAYSPEIFEKRMWKLFDNVYDIIQKENISELNVYDLGDSIDGLLRVSQLWKLRYGVVESTIKYADFISRWLNELSRVVKIKFQMVIDANHSQLRQLGQPKNTFKNDNMSKVIAAFIKERLKENKNFTFVENETGMIFDSLSGYSVLGIHGETKNMDDTLKNLERVYKTNINYLFAGHIHHSKHEEVGQYVETLNVPSIIGIDDYSLSLLKASNASAKMFCFEENNGKKIEYTINLQE